MFLTENMKVIRKKAGLSQEQLGRIIGKTEDSVSLYERGVRDVDNELITVLSDISGISEVELKTKQLKRLDVKIKSDILDKYKKDAGLSAPFSRVGPGIAGRVLNKSQVLHEDDVHSYTDDNKRELPLLLEVSIKVLGELFRSPEFMIPVNSHRVKVTEASKEDMGGFAMDQAFVLVNRYQKAIA